MTIATGTIVKVRGLGHGKIIESFTDRNGLGYVVEIAVSGKREIAKASHVRVA